MRNTKVWVAFSLLIGLCVMYLHMNTFQMEHATYYAAFRYRFKVDRIFTDLWTKTALESDCFAYKYEYPYIFLYGIGGYTKVNLIPFYGETIKVVNETYYRNIPDDLRSDVLSSLSQLNESYLWGIEIRYDFIGLPKRDIDIFKELQRKGREKKVNYIKRESYYASDKKFMKEYIDSRKGLDMLDKKLEGITLELENK